MLTKNTSTQSIDGLTEAVNNYLAKHVYDGFAKPFSLGGLEYLSSSRVHVILCGISDELEYDFQWESGLNDVGQSFGVRLTLSPSSYRK